MSTKKKCYVCPAIHIWHYTLDHENKMLIRHPVDDMCRVIKCEFCQSNNAVLRRLVGFPRGTIAFCMECYDLLYKGWPEEINSVKAGFRENYEHWEKNRI